MTDLPAEGLRYISLFSGAGGLDLALDHMGAEPIVQVENAEYPRSILDLRWPDVPKHDDVRTFRPIDWQTIERDPEYHTPPSKSLPAIDMVIGGPPCQPVSHAGLRRGDDDSRWLWGEALRVVEEARPRIVFFENPMGIRTLGLDGILNRLDALGYGGAWEVVAAADVGAPHLRKRIFIMGVRGHKGWEGPTRPPGNRKVLWPSPNASGERPNEGNVRLLRQRVLAGDMTEDEAKGMLNGKSPFAAQGKVPALWPTPHGNTGNSKGGAFDGHGSELSQAVLVAEGLSDSERSAKRVPLIPSPRAADGVGGPWLAGEKREGGPNLREYVRQNPEPPKMWLTPSANEDAAGTINGNMQNMLTHQAKRSDPEGTAAGGQLNPDWCEWLMGWPVGWTDASVPYASWLMPKHLDWVPEPDIPRVGRGIPNRPKRLQAIGNGVVPQQAEFAFRRLRERIGW